jgi:membrane protease YdiL (CAAX protease family)
VNIFILSLLFSMVHILWQNALPILPLALCLGGLRQLSGSIWPSFLLHAAFNSVGFVADSSRRANETLADSKMLPVAGFAATILLVFIAIQVSNSSARAARARELDSC